MGTLVPSGFKLISFEPLRPHPAFVTARRLFVCGKIALISGWCSAKTTGFMLLRKFCSGGDGGLERDFVTEAFQALDVITGQTLRFETVEKVAAQVGVARSCSHHVIENHQ